MADFKRATRVAELLKQEISQIIAQDIKDPLVGMATVTRVKLTDDLRFARVYISVVGDANVRENSVKGLERANGFIRTELRKRTDLRMTPELRFVLDNSADYAMNIESLLKKAKS